MPFAFLFTLATTTRRLCWLALALSLALPATGRTRHAKRHHHRSRLPKMLPTVIPTAREGFETVLRGRASWYGKFFQGKKTSSGERYDRFQFTCAHKTLPFGTRLRVTNVQNGLTVVVRVSDRGPFRHQRILDLSERAAQPLGVCEAGASSVVAVVVPSDTPLGMAETPPNLALLCAADPQPRAPFTAYQLPALPTGEAMVATLPEAGGPLATASPLAPVPGSKFVVQAGTFTDSLHAETMLARIRTIDPTLEGTIELTTVAGLRARRVVISRLGGWLAAEAVRRNLRVWGIAGSVQQVPTAGVAAAQAVAGTNWPAALPQ